MNKIKEKIKASIAISFIIICFFIVGIVMIQYAVEGEKNLPFKLGKILIVSTAEGIENSNQEEKWNFNILQNNDIYIYIEKNRKNKKEQLLKSVSIENIKIETEPKKGEIKVYMPNSSEGRMFLTSEEYEVQENKLTYKGGAKSNLKTLEIGNQGGNAVIRFSNVGLGIYASNEDEEIIHDGTLLKKIDVENRDLEFKVTFDLIIKIDNNSYKTNVELDLPCGDILENGTTSLELDEKNYIFKRIENYQH